MRGMGWIHPRDELMRTMERIYRYRMTTTSGGNISIRDENGDIWITPARVDKGNLKREDMACVHSDGSFDGPHPPSSELPFHEAIYRARPDLMGIVHAHPVALVAFSITGEVPNTNVFHQARHVCGKVGFAPYELPGSAALGRVISETMRQGYDCVVLENHGVVTGGESLQEAFQRFETLEFAAKTIIKGNVIGNIRYLTDDEVELPRRSFSAVPEYDREPPTSREKDMRQRLCEFVRRGYQQRLMISTEGSFSARLDSESFLITPYKVDRCSLEVEDIVLVRKGRVGKGRRPSRAVRNHMAIYDRHPDIYSIVNAYTVNSTAFSLTGEELNSRTIPESYVFLREIGCVPYGVQFIDPEQLASFLDPSNPILIFENDGVLVAGGSILEAFDRLEVLESTAEAIINSRALGNVSPMPESAIEELKRAFDL